MAKKVDKRDLAKAKAAKIVVEAVNNLGLENVEVISGENFDGMTKHTIVVRGLESDEDTTMDKEVRGIDVQIKFITPTPKNGCQYLESEDEE